VGERVRLLPAAATILLCLLAFPSGSAVPAARTADSITVGSPLYTVDLSTFWGAVGQFGSNPSTPALRAVTNSTPLQVFRFADGMDTTNISSGVSWTPGTSSASSGPEAINVTSDWQFCEELSTQCTFIFQLPGETDSAGDVRAALQFLVAHGISPAYYSIGNEPTLWNHWDKAWSTWMTSDSSTPTGLQYAQEVQAMIPVIRSVVPGAKIIGIEDSSCSNDSFVQKVALVDGPNLSAIACHAYPTGSQDVSGAGLQQFYNVLEATGANPAVNVPKVRAAVAYGCASCSVPVWVDEYNAIAGADPAHFSRYMSSYPDFVLTAGDMVDALAVGTPHVLFFQYWAANGGNYAMVNGSGLYLRPTYYWLADYAASLPGGQVSVLSTSIAASVTPVVAQVFQVASVNSVVIVNANATTAETVTLPAMLANSYGGRSVYWDNTTQLPTLITWTAAPPQVTYTLQPQSVLLVDSERIAPVSGSGGTNGSGLLAPTAPAVTLDPSTPSGLFLDAVIAGVVILGVVLVAATSRRFR
jgi:hypothetical protein